MSVAVQSTGVGAPTPIVNETARRPPLRAAVPHPTTTPPTTNSYSPTNNATNVIHTLGQITYFDSKRR
eukprot:scaffold13584_cov184-Alexandrium_tamarense.AAC.6